MRFTGRDSTPPDAEKTGNSAALHETSIFYLEDSRACAISILDLEDKDSMTNPTAKVWPNTLTPSELANDKKFVKARREIRREWEQRSGKQRAKSELAELCDDWLARKIYRELRAMVQEGSWIILKKRLDHRRSLKRGRYSIENRPFKIGLIEFLDETIPCLPNRRRELSDAMEYAYLHGVPSKYFNGFVKQAGQKQIAAKLKLGHVEPGFKASRMLTCPRDEAKTP